MKDYQFLRCWFSRRVSNRGEYWFIYHNFWASPSMRLIGHSWDTEKCEWIHLSNVWHTSNHEEMILFKMQQATCAGEWYCSLPLEVVRHWSFLCTTLYWWHSLWWKQTESNLFEVTFSLTLNLTDEQITFFFAEQKLSKLICKLFRSDFRTCNGKKSQKKERNRWFSLAIVW